jgi:hypothetical protein
VTFFLLFFFPRPHLLFSFSSRLLPQKSTVERLMETFADLNCMNVCGIDAPAGSGLDLQDTGMNVFKKRKGGLPVA